MATNTTPNVAPTWRVVAQLPTEQFLPGGNSTRGVDITIETAGGNTVTVFVPDTAYTAEKVRPLLAAAARNADEVGALTGGTAPASST